MINTPHPSSTPRDARTVSDLNVAPGRIGSVADWATRSETLLAEAKPELWSKLDSIPCLAWRARPGGFAEYLNKRWLDFTGVSLQQAVGWQWQAAIHPDDLSGLNGAWRQILGSGTSGKIEARMRRFDGTYRWDEYRHRGAQSRAVCSSPLETRVLDRRQRPSIASSTDSTPPSRVDWGCRSAVR